MVTVIVAANLHHGKHSKKGLKRNQTLNSGFRSFQDEIDLASIEEKHVRSDNRAGHRKANEEGARLTGTLQKKIVAEKVTWQDRFICITDGTNCEPTPLFFLAARFHLVFATHWRSAAAWMVPAAGRVAAQLCSCAAMRRDRRRVLESELQL
jgi:hypothetical protein